MFRHLQSSRHLLVCITPGAVMHLLPPLLIGGYMIGLIILGVIFVGAAWFAGRKYERKQFVKIGTPKSDLQKVLGVWKNEAR